MSHIEISSDEFEESTVESDESANGETDNFQLFIKLCKKNKWVPLKYINDINRMYNKCSDKQQKSTKLCKLILNGTENITSKTKNSFQYAAEVYNELLKLTKNKDLQIENDVASTSNSSSCIIIDSESENKNKSTSDKIFNEFISKCYQNNHFPNANIEVVDKLYKSLPPEFVNSEYFILLLKEANQAIWPDSNASLYTHVEHVYHQLKLFHSSMQVQDKNVSEENKVIDKKKLKKLEKLKVALKTIRKQIKILDEKEMDINDEDQFSLDSPYLLKDKFEKKIIEIYKKICSLTNEPNYLDEPKLSFKQTSNKLVNRTIETYYNHNKVFPDYFEIYTLLKVLVNKKKLNWTESQLKSISQDAFIKLGKQLKFRRLNEYLGRLAQDITEKDPAEDDLELKKKLDESNKKLNDDLNAVTEKFIYKQDYNVETEESSHDDTGGETVLKDEYIEKNQNYSKKLKTTNPVSVDQKRKLSNNTDSDEYNILSEDECINESNHSNKKFKTHHDIPIGHKKQLSNNTQNDESSHKTLKTIHLENLGLTPCVPTLNQLNYVSDKEEETSVGNKMVIHETEENINNVINTNDSMDIQELNNSDGNIANSNAAGTRFGNRSSILFLDEDIILNDSSNDIIEIQLEPNQEDEDINNDTNINKKTTNGELSRINVNDNYTTYKGDYDYNVNITEPEVIIEEEVINQSKEVIEINDQDSDIEITSCDPPKDSVKPSLESIIKAMNFDKQYNWDPHVPRPTNSNSRPSREFQRIDNSNSPNLNNKLVNRWVMSNAQNVQLPRSFNSTKQTKSVPKNNPNNRLQWTNPRMQSTSMVQKSLTQRGKNFTQHYNTQTTVQNRRNCSNDQPIDLDQQMTMMTTTTTVQQIVHKTQTSNQIIKPFRNHVRGQLVTSSSHSNRNWSPELIELD